jgi:hypothetical protein
MKIIAVLEGDATDGGGFAQSLNAALQMRRLCDGRFEFEVLTDRSANVAALAQLGIVATLAPYTLRDKLLALLRASAWGNALQRRLRMVGPFEKALFARGCDLAYFLAPSNRARSLQKLNYIATLWDLCHRDTPEFPEVREFGEFQVRERLFGAVLARRDLPRRHRPGAGPTSRRRNRWRRGNGRPR